MAFANNFFRVVRETPLAVLAICLGGLLIPPLRTFFIPGANDGVGFYLANSHITFFEVLCIAVVMLRSDAKNSVFAKLPASALVLIGLWALVSVVTSMNAVEPLHAWIKTFQYGVHLLFGLALVPLFRQNHSAIKYVMIAFLLGFVLYSILMVWGLFKLGEDELEQLSWYYPGFTNVRLAGFYTAMALAVANGLLFFSDRAISKKSQVGLIFVLIWCWGLLLWTGSRGAVLSLMASGGVILLFLKPPMWRAILLTNAISALLGALGSLGVPIEHESFGLKRFFLSNYEGKTTNQFTSGRLQMWIEASVLWSERPWLGYGTGQSRFLLPSTGGVFSQPHNIVVNALFSWGVLGGVPFLIFMSALFTKAVKLVNQENGLLIGALAAILSLAFNALLDGSLYHAFPLLFFTIFAAAIFSYKADASTC